MSGSTIRTSPSASTRTPPKGSHSAARRARTAAPTWRRSRLERGGGDRGRLDDPGEGGAAARRIEDLVGEADSGSLQERRVIPLVATAPAAIRSSCSGSLPEGSSTRIGRARPRSRRAGCRRSSRPRRAEAARPRRPGPPSGPWRCRRGRSAARVGGSPCRRARRSPSAHQPARGLARRDALRGDGRLGGAAGSPATRRSPRPRSRRPGSRRPGRRCADRR